MSDYRIDVEAKLKNGSKTDVQKQLDNIMKNIKADTNLAIDFAKSKNEIAKQTDSIAKYMQQEFNKVASSLKLPELNDKDSLKYAKQYVNQYIKLQEDKSKTIIEQNKIVEKSFTELRKNVYQSIGNKSPELQQMAEMYKQEAIEAEKFAKEQNNLVNAMERVRVKTEQTREAEEKRHELAQSKASNKALEEEYAAIEEINQALSSHKLEKDVFSQTGKYKTLIDVSDSLKSDFAELTALSNKLNTSLGNQEKIDTYKKYQQALASVKNQVSLLSTSENTLATAEKRLDLASTIEAWNQKNSKAKDAVKANKEYIVSLRNIDNAISDSKVDDMGRMFKQNENAARNAGKLGLSFFDGLKQQASTFTQWIGISGAVMTTVSSLRKMKDAVYDIDTSMTNLYKVSDETGYKYDQFLDNANSKAQELGRTVSSLIEQTADWKKLGFSMDESAKLSEISSIYSNVGEVDDNTAVSDMVTAMKALDIEAKDSITIIDELNNLSNKYAVSAAGLGEGLRNSASALALQGNSLEQILALLTGGGEITQNVGELGNMLKVASLRLASMKGELEEIGESYDKIESISKNQTQIYNMTKGQVDILDEQNGKLKNTFTILKEVASAWEDVESLDKSELLELMFGKQRANQGAAIIKAFQSGQIQKAFEDANNSAGSAQEEQDRWLQSLDAKIKQNTASFQQLSQTVINSDFLKGLVDSGTNFLNILNEIISSFGTMNTLAATGGIVAFIKNLDYPAEKVRRYLKIA